VPFLFCFYLRCAKIRNINEDAKCKKEEKATEIHLKKYLYLGFGGIISQSKRQNQKSSFKKISFRYLFFVKEDIFNVFAIFHFSRNSAIWKHRIKKAKIVRNKIYL